MNVIFIVSVIELIWFYRVLESSPLCQSDTTPVNFSFSCMTIILRYVNILLGCSK